MKYIYGSNAGIFQHLYWVDAISVLNLATAISNLWQLPTAIVLMLVAGTLMWCNLNAEKVGITPALWAEPARDYKPQRALGWPLPAYPSYDLYYGFDTSGRTLFDARDEWKFLPIVIDAMIAAGVIIAAAKLCASLIRRRERNRTE